MKTVITAKIATVPPMAVPMAILSTSFHHSFKDSFFIRTGSTFSISSLTAILCSACARGGYRVSVYALDNEFIFSNCQMSELITSTKYALTK